MAAQILSIFKDVDAMSRACLRVARHKRELAEMPKWWREELARGNPKVISGEKELLDSEFLNEKAIHLRALMHHNMCEAHRVMGTTPKPRVA